MVVTGKPISACLTYKQTAQQVLNARQPLAIAFSVLLQPLCGAREEFRVDDGRHCHADVSLSRCGNLSVGPLWHAGVAARRMQRRLPRQALAATIDGLTRIGGIQQHCVDCGMPRSPGHVFYDRLQEVLIAGGFDGFVETACQPYYAPKMGTPSLPPGRYFRMHLVGYFEGIASERGIVWRCSDSMSLRDFLRLESPEKIPDHSWLSKTRGRLPHEVHETVFGWVLKLVAEQGLVKGKRIGVDASTMEANAALRTIVRRDDGRT